MAKRWRIAVVLCWLVVLVLPVNADQGAEQAPPTVLLVTIDTVRADHLGCYGHHRRTTPVIDHLSSEGLLFREALSSVPLTTPSHASIFTGLHPRSHAVLGNSWQLDHTRKTMAECFRGAGYRTAAFVSAVVLDPRCGLDRGFQYYGAIERRGPGAVLHRPRPGEPPGEDGRSDPTHRMAGRHRRGTETVDEALAWMSAQPGNAPLFVWVHLYDPHQPYDPPEPFRRLFGPERGGRNLATILRPAFNERPFDLPEEEQRRDEDRRRRSDDWVPSRERLIDSRSITVDERQRIGELYDGEVALADFQVGRLLAWIKGHGRYDNALIAVLGDHGEVLGEHLDYFGHHHLLYDASLRVPLAIRLPGGGQGCVMRQPVSTVDVAPTILRAAGISSPGGIDGRDLQSRPLARPVYCETYLGTARRALPLDLEHRSVAPGHGTAIHQHAVRDGRWKLVLAVGPETSPKLFDLDADPGEQTNVADDHQALVRALQKHWDLWCADHALPRRERNHRSAPGVDEEMRDRLRQLGYVE